ncbi:hypothetical protein P4133_17225 [Pseudomonas aeruginosa]|nr:hypothetical protein [Pseudomonas aeruginosa]
MQWIFMLVGLILGGFAGESLVGALLGGLPAWPWDRPSRCRTWRNRTIACASR